MSHARTQIRDEVVTAVTGLTTTGSNVFVHHPYLFDDSQLPCLNVVMSGDAVSEEDLQMGVPEQHWRAFSFEVQVRVKENSTYMATLDGICVEVESALADVAAITAITKSFNYRETVYSVDGESEKPVGLATLIYEGAYSIASTDPETITV